MNAEAYSAVTHPSSRVSGSCREQKQAGGWSGMHDAMSSCLRRSEGAAADLKCSNHCTQTHTQKDPVLCLCFHFF